MNVFECPDCKPMIGISNKIPVAGCHHANCYKISGYPSGYISCDTMIAQCPRGIKLAEQITNTHRVRCKKTDCIDYNKELCSPWMCTHYLKAHDKFVKLDTIASIKNEIENALNIRDRYWKGLQKAIDIINKKMTKEQS